MEGIELRVAIEEARGLMGARLAKVHQVGEVFFLRFFSPTGALVLDVSGKAFHRTALRPPTPPEPPPLCRILRRLEGQKLLAIDQAGYDRIVRLRLQGGALILDLRPRLGNLFLIQDGRAVASLREGTYPPVEFGQAGDVLAGVGPSLKRAASYYGQPEGEEALRAFFAKLLAQVPRGFLYETDQGLVASFFPRPDLGEAIQEFPSFWQALDRALEVRLSLSMARRYLQGVKQAILRRRRALKALFAERKEAARWAELKEKADLILARLSDIPRGRAEVEVEGFEGKQVRLKLDPTLTPVAYAQALYRRAGKLRRRLSALPKREEVLREELAKLKELEKTLTERPELAPYLAGELSLLGALTQERHGKATLPARPRQLRIGDFTVLVGRSAEENDRLVRQASPNDLWLHARGVPGAHVLLRTGGRRVPEEVLYKAAQLAAWHSQARGERKVAVSYTEARHVRKPKGAPAGTVILKEESVIVVSGEEGP
ncbi:MAG: Putative RNA-binding protein, snRNP like protein [Acetothermia bacterium 64_32]|nr:MAG: Putative RNA-binding protein, snRNP like protein [Acetothermia bacterium 64_32]HAF69888.1 hypothetical protein [Candidatus Acetothermia bacterium]